MSRLADERLARVQAAVALEDWGGVALVPQLCKTAAMRLQGLPQAAGNDLYVALDAMMRTFEQFGGWDGLYTEIPDTMEMQTIAWMQPLRFLLPGVDLPEDAVMQVDEREVLQPDEYDVIAETGWSDYYFSQFLPRITQYSAEQIPGVIEKLMADAEACVERWKALDVTPLYFIGRPHPFFFLCLARSMVKFTEDLYYRPELVSRALSAMTREWIEEVCATGASLEGGPRYVLMAEERAQEYSPGVFEKMWWEHTRAMVEAFHEAGLVTWLHLDCNWNRKLEYFKQLPKGSFVLQLDSMTDIRLAKQVLGGHCALHGDLPPSLQAVGSVEEVRAYCRGLVADVGRGGGFILGTGCEVATDCRPENFQAMLEAAR